MKKLFKLFALASLALIVAVACNDKPVTPEVKTLTAPTLSVTPTSAVIDSDSDDTALTFNWNDVASEGLTPVYNFQVTRQGDNDFAAGTAYECTGTSKAFSHAEIAALAGEIGASLDEGFTLMARLRVTAKDNKDVEAVFSNTVTAAVGKAQYPIENLYPIGEATPYGWSLDNTVAMERSGNIFTWEGHLYANAEFKFLLQKDWWPGLVNASGDDPFTFNPVIRLEDGADYKFKVGTEGQYLITIDATNTNDIKMTAELLEEQTQELVIQELIIIGNATKTGWSLDAAEAFTKDGDIYTWEGYLSDSGEFRFPCQRDWWPGLMIPADGGTSGTLVRGNSDGDKVVYNVDEPGNYRIRINAKDLSYTIEFLGAVEPSEYATLFMCGDATPYGWSTAMTEASQLKPENVDKYIWGGNLTASGTFKFLTKADWAPSYNRDASAADYWTMTYRENYDQPDEQFKVEADGTYIVEANIYTMKVAVSLVEGLYILGGATDTGWSLDDMAAFAKDGSKYTISCNLKAGEEFRFPLQKKSGVWWPCLMIAEDGESLVIGYDDSDKVAYKLTESGNYTVTVDLDTMKCNFSR
ncbi:MAG: SusF/SusE family outer membrane protein [Bacteroidales bacterium]|nr:SusF/SusE family outer membrane protein [Bacteroidales bacterium]